MVALSELQIRLHFSNITLGIVAIDFENGYFATAASLDHKVGFDTAAGTIRLPF